MDETGNYRAVIAEDEPLIRENLVKKIRRQLPDIEIVGEAEDGSSALEMLDRFHPDLLLTDIRMPVMDGLDLIRETYFNYPDVIIVVISGYDEFAYAKAALQYGVRDYLLKPISVSELRRALTRVTMQIAKDRSEFELESGNRSARAAQEELVDAVREFLRSHFAEPVSISDIARRFHVSAAYLARTFKSIGGVAPVRHLRDLRIAHARVLLVQRPELEVKEVAPLCGYSDQAYFCRVFKTATGVTPSEFRERDAQ
ncbi:response regulator transcription factor [Salinispira pacifica]